MALDRTTLSHVLKIPNENLGKPGPLRKVYQNLDKLIFVVKVCPGGAHSFYLAQFNSLLKQWVWN